MGDEHDSWLEELGVNFDPPDPSALVSDLKEAANSGLNAARDLDRAKTDLANAASTEIVAKNQYVEAGLLDAVDAHDAAQDLHNRADANEADANVQFNAGVDDLGQVEDDVSGGDDVVKRTLAEPKYEDSKKAKSLRSRKIPMGVIPMLPDCKIVRGKVPGPANHVLCCTHNHIVDLGTKTIIALSLEDYQKRYGTGGGGA